MDRQASRILLDIARKAIESYIRKIPYKLDRPALVELNQTNGVFVTLRIEGHLRGCIGQFTSTEPLYQAVYDKAIASAIYDPRFPPVTESELEKLEIEISILTPLEKIDDVNLIKLGVHGVLIEKYGRRGVFLPEVAIEQGWDLTSLLENLCYKAGLSHHDWKHGARFYIFSSEKIKETRLIDS